MTQQLQIANVNNISSAKGKAHDVLFEARVLQQKNGSFTTEEIERVMVDVYGYKRTEITRIIGLKLTDKTLRIK